MDTSRPAWLIARDIHAQRQQAEKDRTANSIQRQTDRVMNTKTDSTGLYGANKSQFKTSLTQDITKILDRNNKLDIAKDSIDKNLNRMNTSDIENIIK